MALRQLKIGEGNYIVINDYRISDAQIAAWNAAEEQSDWNESDSSDHAYIKNKPTSLPASDVYAWAKAANKPSYTLDEVSDGTTRKLSNYLLVSAKGAAGGVAELDANGLVPSSQLPSYVDDVLEYASRSSFPATGETGKIYVALDTNLTYRWSGTAYVEISPSLALGELESTAYRGDRGATAYSHATETKSGAQNSGFYKFSVTAQGHVGGVTSVAASDLTSLIGNTTYAPYNSAGYLPLSGGILTASGSPVLQLNNTDPNDVSQYVAFNLLGIKKAEVGYWAYSAYIWNNTSGKGLRLYDNGAITYDNNTVWHQGNDGSGSGLDADVLDGYHEYSFLRYRGGTYTDGENTLWSQIGTKQYNNALPDGLTSSGTYNWGQVISFATDNARAEFYVSHLSSDSYGMYYRSGWDSDKRVWRQLIDSYNISSQSVAYASSSGNADTVDSLHVHTGRNYEANKIVRTDDYGYIQCGYINSSSGDEGNNSSPARVWGTNGSDSYLRTYLTSALSVGNANTLDGEHRRFVSYTTTSVTYPNGWWKINITYENHWMLAFTVRLYQGYEYQDITFTGYNYAEYHWYEPEAVMNDGAAASTSVTVKFGYDDTFKLWVAIPASVYTGILITNICNGYYNPTDWSDKFTITNVSELTGTVQSTQTVYRPYHMNETVANATYAQNATRLYASDSPYTYSGTYPYYAYMTYDGTHDWWYLRVEPDTPRTIVVDKAHQLSSSVNIFGNSFNGSASIGGNLTLSTGAQLNCQDPNNDGFAINYANGRSSATTSTRFYNGQYSEVMRIASNGYVGIGTSSPSYKLHVNSGAIYASDSIITGNDFQLAGNGVLLVLKDSAKSMVVGYKTNWTSPADMTYLPDYAAFNISTRLGICNSAPAYNLDVSGSANATTLYESGSRVVTTANIGSQTAGYATYLNQIASSSEDTAMPPSGQFGVYHMSSTSASGADGHIMAFDWSDGAHYGAQIFIDTDPTRQMSFRQRASDGTWTSWNEIIHSNNWSTYIGTSSAYVGYANYASEAGNASFLLSTDARSSYPNSIVGAGKAKLAFLSASYLGISNHGTWYDTFILRSYGDNSAGDDTAIMFDKNGDDVWHTRFSFGSTNSWGSPIKFIDTNNYSSYALPLSGGTMNTNAKIYMNSSSTDQYYGGALEIREYNYCTTSQSDWAYAPGITFHWGGYAVNKLGIATDGSLRWGNSVICTASNISSYAITSHQDISGKVDKVSSARPGVTKLYRSDDNSDYNVQTSWTGSYWVLKGYNGDTYHAECQVYYSNYSGYAYGTDWSYVNNRPTNVSSFTNDAGYITSSGSCSYATSAGSAGRIYSNDYEQYFDVTDDPADINSYEYTCIPNCDAIKQFTDQYLSEKLCYATRAASDFTCYNNYYYILSSAVGTITITLPSPNTFTSSEHQNEVMFYFTTGSSPSITFTSSRSVYYYSNFKIEANKTYEVHAMFNGSAWILASTEVASSRP